VNEDLEDPTAPWSAGDDDEESGFGPKPGPPMIVPEDYDDDDSEEEEKEPPKGVPVPVWSGLQAGLLGAVATAAAMSNPPSAAAREAVPPTLLTSPTPDTLPIVLPDTPFVPTVPCAQDAACGFVMGAIDPVLPPSTRALLNIPGTCQNWSREWLRTGKDVMEFQVHRVRQRFAMAMMYCEFDGDNWLESELWVSDLHECDWYTMIGVDPCGKSEQYQIIRNYGQQMRGTLPPEISMISSLWEITLSDNLLEGPIPPEYAKLSELDTFILSFNLFKGDIPDFMWKYEDMVYMDLGYNFFNSEIPSNIPFTEPNLRVLFLENNDIQGALPNDFGALDWKRLHLDGNNLEGPIPPKMFQGKSRFEELYLHRNDFSGEIPPGLADQNKMTELTLYDNPELTGDVNDICKNFDAGIGLLKVAQVDTANVACECCGNGDNL